jgi:hypothetical protein
MPPTTHHSPGILVVAVIHWLVSLPEVTPNSRAHPKKKKKRGYRVCSSGYAATDTS